MANLIIFSLLDKDKGTCAGIPYWILSYEKKIPELYSCF
jgi:hypothetical protein